MRAIFQLFWNICLYRVGPEKVPPAPALLILVVLLDLVIAIAWLSTISNLSLFQSAIISMAAWLACQAVIVALLKFKRLSHRIIPTLSAWNGTDVILSCVIIPIQFMNLYLHTQSILAAVIFFSLIAMLIWDALVKGFIFYHALNISRLQGTALAVALNVLLFWLNKLLIGN